MELTSFFESFAHDMDFKIAMRKGLQTLEQQIKELEKLCLNYGVVLPERPPISMKVPVDPESLEDRFMFQQIFMGVDNMVDAHIRAVIEITRNDSLRNFFFNYFEDELELHDKIIKYGKAKGWLIVPPVFNQGTSG